MKKTGYTTTHTAHFIILTIILFILFIFSIFSSMPFALAGIQHGVNGRVLDAPDGTESNGADVTLTLDRLNCELYDKVGEDGNSKKEDFYAIDVGNCEGEWLAGDRVFIYVEVDALHHASTYLTLTGAGNDQAPDLTLSAPAPECGDGICQNASENCLNCSEDCPYTCDLDGFCELCEGLDCPDCMLLECNFDGICEPWEECCWFDCPCGDDYCFSATPFFETNETCPEDCRCGDGICRDVFSECYNITIFENAYTCPADCYGCFCGNLICEPDCGEDQITCPVDCSLLCNYNDICEFGEFYPMCPDCEPYCGNMKCEPELGETPENCPSDCGPMVCGDGICDVENGENWQNCPVDCYSAKCGDGECKLAETSENCCADCSCDRGLWLWILPIYFYRCRGNVCRLWWNWWLILVALAIGGYIYYRKWRKKKIRRLQKLGYMPKPKPPEKIEKNKKIKF